MGYVLLPTTKGQKMMIVIGKGGEGKSRIGRVLRALLGDSMNTGSIQRSLFIQNSFCAEKFFDKKYVPFATWIRSVW